MISPILYNLVFLLNFYSIVLLKCNSHAITQLCTHDLYLILEYFCHCPNKSHTPSTHSLFPPPIHWRWYAFSPPWGVLCLEPPFALPVFLLLNHHHYLMALLSRCILCNLSIGTNPLSFYRDLTILDISY